MAFSRVAVQLGAPVGAERLGERLRSFAVAVGILTLLAVLSAAYFRVNAGIDYPEPSIEAGQ